MICCTNVPTNKIFCPYRESSHYFPYSIKKESPSILDSLPSSPRSLRAIDQEGYIRQVKEQYCPLGVSAHATLYLEGEAGGTRSVSRRGLLLLLPCFPPPPAPPPPSTPPHNRVSKNSPSFPYSPLDRGGGGSFFCFHRLPSLPKEGKNLCTLSLGWRRGIFRPRFAASAAKILLVTRSNCQ